MANEITAEMLAEWIAENIGGDPRAWSQDARSFLTLTRAYAALQAQPTEAPDQCSHPFCGPTCGSEPTEAPGRVRCWYVEDYGIVMNLASSDFIGRNITPGHFTPDTDAHE